MRLNTQTLLKALEGKLPMTEILALTAELRKFPSSALLSVLRSEGVRIDGDGNIVGNNNVGVTVKGQIDTELKRLLHEAIAGARALYQLPMPPSDFIGRTAERRELSGALEAGETTIVGVRGMAGVGKTAMALKLAEQLAEHYPDAQLYLDLKEMSSFKADPDAAVAYVIRSFYPTLKIPEQKAELLAMYRSTLHSRRAILVIENVEDSSQLTPLVPPSGCLLLFTSRQRFTLPGLVALDLKPLPPSEAEALLLSICPRILHHANTLARLCAYLPLALRWTASAMAERIDISPPEYVKRLRSAKPRLELVDASMDLSYDLLKLEMQKHFRALAVFVGTFDADAAAAVWKIPTVDAQDLLSQLVAGSCVEWDHLKSRYHLHDLVRLFADSRLAAVERRTVQIRHSAYYEGKLRTLNETYMRKGDGLRKALTSFDIEWSNIRAGQAWAVHFLHTNATAARLSSKYAQVGANIGRMRLAPSERIQWLQAGLTASRLVKDRRTEMEHLKNLGQTHLDLGQPLRAVSLHKKGLQIGRTLHNRTDLADAFLALGADYWFARKTKTAINYYESALVIRRELRDRKGEGEILRLLGMAYRDLGDIPGAIQHHEACLAITRELPDRRSEALALDDLAEDYCKEDQDKPPVDRSQIRRGIQLGNVALSIFQQMHDPDGEELVLSNQATRHEQMGDQELAIEAYKKAMAISRELGDHISEACTLTNMAQTFAGLGELSEAISCAEAALEIFESFERSADATFVQSKLDEWQS